MKQFGQKKVKSKKGLNHSILKLF